MIENITSITIYNTNTTRNGIISAPLQNFLINLTLFTILNPYTSETPYFNLIQVTTANIVTNGLNISSSPSLANGNIFFNIVPTTIQGSITIQMSNTFISILSELPNAFLTIPTPKKKSIVFQISLMVTNFTTIKTYGELFDIHQGQANVSLMNLTSSYGGLKILTLIPQLLSNAIINVNAHDYQSHPHKLIDVELTALSLQNFTNNGTQRNIIANNSVVTLNGYTCINNLEKNTKGSCLYACNTTIYDYEAYFGNNVALDGTVYITNTNSTPEIPSDQFSDNQALGYGTNKASEAVDVSLSVNVNWPADVYNPVNIL